MNDRLSLLDWRRRIAALYAEIRQNPDPEAAWRHWRQTRDDLFRTHPQSPIEDLSGFTALPLFDYDPALRFEVDLNPVHGAPRIMDAGDDGAVTLEPIARTSGLATALGGELTVYWMKLYGGGIFVPFTDATNGCETYGGGRYVLDTIKCADLGSTKNGKLVLDFNFSYHPSCTYSNRYTCPLAPGENRLKAAIRGGERLGHNDPYHQPAVERGRGK